MELKYQGDLRLQLNLQAFNRTAYGIEITIMIIMIIMIIILLIAPLMELKFRTPSPMQSLSCF